MLKAMWRRHPNATFGDVDACINRPGSWEYQEPIAYEMREQLKRWGYVQEDTEHEWRKVWVR